MAAEFPPALRPGFYPALLKGKTDWHEADLTRWAQWIAEVPDMDRGRLAAKVAESIGAVSPEAAAAWALELPGGTERHTAMRAAVGIWSRVDAASSSEWVNELPRGTSRDEAASALVNSIAASEPDAAWAWMLDIAHDRERQAAAQTVLAALHRKDPARARLLAQSPELPEGARAWFKRKFIDPAEAESGPEGH